MGEVMAKIEKHFYFDLVFKCYKLMPKDGQHMTDRRIQYY